MPSQQQPRMMPNGPMPNGMPPNALPPGSMQPGAPNSFQMGGPGGPQPNGISGPPVPPGGPNPNFLGQRLPLNGPQSRGPLPPFQSPTMAHSPQGGPGPQQQPQLSQHQQPQHLGMGPSPHLMHMNRGGMLPPNVPQQGMNPGQQTPTTSYQQLTRPPSRTATPGGSSGMPHPSPSMTARQPPGITGNDPRQEGSINNELMNIPASMLQQLKLEVGLTDKDLPSFSLQDKVSCYLDGFSNMPPT